MIFRFFILPRQTNIRITITVMHYIKTINISLSAYDGNSELVVQNCIILKTIKTFNDLYQLYRLVHLLSIGKIAFSK